MAIFHIFRGIKEDSGEIILINSDVTRIVVIAPESVQIDTERREEG